MRPPITSETVAPVCVPPVDALVDRILCSEWVEVPAREVQAQTLLAAVEAGVVRVVRVDGVGWVRLVPDPADRAGAPDETALYTTEGASAHAAHVWTQHLGVYRRLLAAVREQTPHDAAALAAMEAAVRMASRQLVIGYRVSNQR